LLNTQPEKKKVKEKTGDSGEGRTKSYDQQVSDE